MKSAEAYRGVRWPEDGRPVVVHGRAEMPVKTNGQASVFHLKGRKTVPAPDPRSLETIPGPPPERRLNGHPPSPWAKVYESLRADRGLSMTHAQAEALACWARNHGKKVIRRRIDGETCGVWRAEG